MGVTIAEAQILGIPVAVLANYENDAEQVRFLVETKSVADLGFHGGSPTLASKGHRGYFQTKDGGEKDLQVLQFLASEKVNVVILLPRATSLFGFVQL